MRASQLRVGATPFALAAVLIASCNDTFSPPGGVLRVAVTTSGVDHDTDGYLLVFGSTSSRRVPSNGDVVLTGLAPGEYFLRLEEVDPNCTIAGNPPIVLVRRLPTPRVSFAVTCVLRTGRIRVTTTTTGAEIDPDGYGLRVDGGAERSIGANETITIDDVLGGNRGVDLARVARNCRVANGNSRSVVVPFGGGIVDVVFAVECVASGRIEVTTASSGVDVDPNGYTVTVRRAEFDTTANVATTGAVAVSTLIPGDYEVILGGVAANCDVGGMNPRTVNVAAGAATAVPFDVTCGAATRLAVVRMTEGNPDIWTINSNGTGATRLMTHAAADVEAAWSPDGSKIAFTSNRAGNEDIYVMSANGSGVVRITESAARDRRPAWSPDGLKIAFESNRDGDDGEIYVMNADGSGVTRLTDNDGEDGWPAWSPDGQRIAFTSNRAGNFEIYVVNADGSGVVRLTNHQADDTQPAWSPDGTRLVFAHSVACDFYYGCDRDLYVVGAGGGAVTQLTSGPEDHTEPAWSPDGRKIAFTVTTCDYYCYNLSTSVFVVRVDGTGIAEVTNGSTSSPSWRR